MASSILTLGFVAILSSFVVLQFAPEFSLKNSLYRTAVVCFAVECSLYFTYQVIIYPKFISALRHYPEAPVRPFAYPIQEVIIRIKHVSRAATSYSVTSCAHSENRLERPKRTGSKMSPTTVSSFTASSLMRSVSCLLLQKHWGRY